MWGPHRSVPQFRLHVRQGFGDKGLGVCACKNKLYSAVPLGCITKEAETPATKHSLLTELHLTCTAPPRNTLPTSVANQSALARTWGTHTLTPLSPHTTHISPHTTHTPCAPPPSPPQGQLTCPTGACPRPSPCCPAHSLPDALRVLASPACVEYAPFKSIHHLAHYPPPLNNQSQPTHLSHRYMPQAFSMLPRS